MDIFEQKKALRKQIKVLFKTFPADEHKRKSREVLRQLRQCPEFQNSRNIMLFWSMKDEVFTHDFVVEWSSEKQIFLPAIIGDEIEIRRFDGLKQMESGHKYGIPEPIAGLKANAEDIDLIVVPGQAFDKHNNRMGRGKAFYDKLLKNSKATKTGICFDFQFFDQIPVDERDIPMDMVIVG